MNKERLVFEVTDGVKTPEKITPYEGGAHVSYDEILSFLQFNNAQFLSWPLLCVRPLKDLNIFSSADLSSLGIESELGQTHPSLYWV